MTEVVYFAKGPDGRIKIGTSKNVQTRMGILGSAIGGRMELLATLPGGRELESFYHERFEAARDAGEWFHPTDELVEFTSLASVFGATLVPAGFRPEPEEKDEREFKVAIPASKQAPGLISEIIGLRPVGETQKAALNRAARQVSRLMAAGKMTGARLEDIYRGEARRIDADEMDAIRAAAKYAASGGSVSEIAELKSRISALEDALRLLDGRRGGVDRALDQGE